MSSSLSAKSSSFFAKLLSFCAKSQNPDLFVLAIYRKKINSQTLDAATSCIMTFNMGLSQGAG
jgi:hypothetical protein